MLDFNKHNLQDLFSGFSQTGAEKGANPMQALLEAALRKGGLVTREEFDAQQIVLLRTREKLEALERTLTELQNRMESTDPTP